MAEQRIGVCNLRETCDLRETVCGLILTIEDGRVTGARGNPEDPLSRGHICSKGVAIGDIHADPDRLRRPVLRIGRGPDARWEEISWDDALDRVADGTDVDRSLEGLDFCAAVDIYLNETTRHADVILPPTTLLERDHYDLPFHVLAVRDTARLTPAVFEKDADQRHDWQIFAELHRRVTRRLDRKPPLRKRLLTEARVRLSPTFIVGMLLRTGRSDVTLTDLRQHPERVDIGALRPGQLPGRLFTRDKRIQALPPLVAGDLDRLRRHEVPVGDELLLIGRRHQRDCNSWMHNTERLTRGKPRHHLLMHSADLDARGLVDGASVTVTSRVGKVVLEVRATEDVMPGGVSLPHGYGHQRDGVRLGVASTVTGVSINDLTDPDRLDVSGNAALSGVPVTASVS